MSFLGATHTTKVRFDKFLKALTLPKPLKCVNFSCFFIYQFMLIALEAISIIV